MRKKLTLTLDEEVHAGLHRMIGLRGISRFIEDLLRPRVLRPDSSETYEGISQDRVREEEAREWAEALEKDSEPISRMTSVEVFLDPALHRALRLKSAESMRSMSEIINDALRHELAEDADDLATFEDRATEPLLSYEAVLRKLKADGRL